MKYQVFALSDAEADLTETYQYIHQNDSLSKAEDFITGVKEAMRSLENFPTRGHVPAELENLGIVIFKEIHYNFHRIIYEIDHRNVYVHCVVDGRRDMQELLEIRLLR